MKFPLKTFQANEKGRDFVIGDLHGAYRVFENLLKNINFDPTVDRMFSVGDLIDRGPESKKCLELLRQPWFHPVLANHEQLMQSCFDGGYMGRYWFQNGGFWGAEAVNDYMASKLPNNDPAHRYPTTENQEVIDLLELVDEMPYLITVNTRAGKKYHILHAELPLNVGKITDERLSQASNVEALAKITAGDGDAFLWNRALYMPFYKNDTSDRSHVIKKLVAYRPRLNNFNPELSHIISGHTIMMHPLTLDGQTNIDTCAYASVPTTSTPYGDYSAPPPGWAGLTCIELENWKFYKATETSFKEIEPRVFTKLEVDEYIEKRTL